MSKLLTAGLLALSTCCIRAQTEVKVWTRMVGDIDFDYGLAVTTDASRNVIFSGTTHSTLGPVLFGKYDLFVAKYDASGNKQWLVQRGTTEQESAEGIVTDAAGNIYITGYTGGSLDGNSSAGNNDIFLMKLDPSGNWLWTRQDGTGQDDDAHAIAIDSAGNIYITGVIRGDFHGNTRVGVADVFLSKYDPSGNRLWSRLFGSVGVDEGCGIACDSSNNVFVTGYCEESVEGNPYLGNGDAILAKYDSNGNRQWLRQWGSANADTGYAARCDAFGNVYVAGYTSGTLYGPKNGGPDIILAKFDGAGNPLWGTKMGTSENDYAYGVTVDPSGNIYVVGQASGSLQGNPYAGEADAFIAKYNSGGTNLWTAQMGTPNNDVANGVAVDGSGGIYMVGWSTGDFDGYPNQGQNDVFVTKFGFPNSPPPTPTANAATSVTTIGFIANWSIASGATGYRLDLSTNSAFVNYVAGYQNLDVGNVLSRSFSGLHQGTTYYYRVRAYNGNGTSGNSVTIGVTTVATVCTPGVMLNGTFEGPSIGGIGTNWVSYQRAPNPSTVWSIQTLSPPTGGGSQYQQIANTSSTGGGGVRQNVTGCTIGATYAISGWMRGNSASATCTVKCSPTASTLWSSAVDLNPPQSYSGSTWVAFNGTVVASGTNMTIWLDGQTGGTGLNKAECFDSVTVACVVPPAPLYFASFAFLPPDKMRLVVSGPSGVSVTIQRSGDLLSWQPLTNLVNTTGTLTFTDAPPANTSQRFYRATSP